MKIPTISKRQVINMLRTGMTIAKHVYSDSFDIFKPVVGQFQLEDSFTQPEDGVNRYEIAGIEYAGIDDNIAMLQLLDITASAEDGAIDFELIVTSTLKPGEQFVTRSARTSHKIRIELTRNTIDAEIVSSVSDSITDITNQLNQKIREVFWTLETSPGDVIVTSPVHQQKFKPIVI